jgi:hypothetical protein
LASVEQEMRHRGFLRRPALEAATSGRFYMRAGADLRKRHPNTDKRSPVLVSP